MNVAHGNLRHQFGKAAQVILMIVGQQQVIDLAYARVFGRGDDAVRHPGRRCLPQPVSINSDFPAGVTKSVD